MSARGPPAARDCYPFESIVPPSPPEPAFQAEISPYFIREIGPIPNERPHTPDSQGRVPNLPANRSENFHVFTRSYQESRAHRHVLENDNFRVCTRNRRRVIPHRPVVNSMKGQVAEEKVGVHDEEEVKELKAEKEKDKKEERQEVEEGDEEATDEKVDGEADEDEEDGQTTLFLAIRKVMISESTFAERIILALKEVSLCERYHHFVTGVKGNAAGQSNGGQHSQNCSGPPPVSNPASSTLKTNIPERSRKRPRLPSDDDNDEDENERHHPATSKSVDDHKEALLWPCPYCLAYPHMPLLSKKFHPCKLPPSFTERGRLV